MPRAPRPKANQPCPCGSGKKYRDCHALKDERRRRFGRQSRKLLAWVGAIAAGALVVYALSNSGVPYDEAKIGAVNFSGLNASQKRSALQAANRARCNCGCGMTLAQCVATDATCPIRTDNIARIKGMVTDAMQ